MINSKKYDGVGEQVQSIEADECLLITEVLRKVSSEVYKNGNVKCKEGYELSIQKHGPPCCLKILRKRSYRLKRK